jgi:two-component system, OmpR family, sensor histidine kinase KdpD
MKKPALREIKISYQYLLSLLAVMVTAISCYPFVHLIGYRVVAYLLLITVSLAALFFDIYPVLLAAILSALIWDYFFIPPHFTFQVGTAEDSLMLLMYLVIAMVHATLTYKIRRIEKAAILKEEKENTIKLYNTLLNSLSHELRTPIATIIAATDNLQARNINLSAENRQELVKEISKASLRLNQQVENLLNMSRLESGFIKPKNDWCDVGELIYTLVGRIEENNVQQHFHININPDIPLFRLDKGMLEQIVYNILINACNYTPAGSSIDIVAICHVDVLELIIEDNGKGFPEEEIKVVFNKFYRSKNTTTGGTGLGLSIVRGFTEALGGSVQLSNLDTGGARFTINIPAETSYLKNLKNE